MLNELMKFITAEVKAELLAQKHAATGALIKSVRTDLSVEGKTVVMTCSYNFYGQHVDTGRKPGVKRVPVFVLMEWIRVLRLTDEKHVKGMAFAIREKIFQEGIPTSRSRTLAPRRKDFVGYFLSTFSPKILDLISLEYQKNVEYAFDNIIKEMNTKLVTA